MAALKAARCNKGTFASGSSKEQCPPTCPTPPCPDTNGAVQGLMDDVSERAIFEGSAAEAAEEEGEEHVSQGFPNPRSLLLYFYSQK